MTRWFQHKSNGWSATREMGLSWLRQRDLVLVLVLVMGTSSAINLTGDNVCPRLENYTASYSESYTEPVIVNTFAWCLQIPPRCPRSRLENRTRWRVKTELRQRTLMECCEGYVVKETKDEEKIGKDANTTGICEPHCEICEYGRCVAPNTCVCEPGHRGVGCVDECPAGTWGERCSQTCNCEESEICNPVDGKCHCPPGLQGSGCKEKCPAGKWGVDCALSCTCMDKFGLYSNCHHETGICMIRDQSVSNSPGGEETTDAINLGTTIASISAASEKIKPLDTTKRTKTTSNNFDLGDDQTWYDEYDDKSPTDDDDYFLSKFALIKTSTTPGNENNDENGQGSHRGASSTSTTKSSLNVISKDPIVTEISTTESSLIGTSTITTNNENHQNGGSSTSTTKSSLSETSKDPVVSEISPSERSSIAPSTVTTNNGNYNGHQRVERIDTKVSRVKKPSTSHPIVAVVHVSGNGSPGHDGPMIISSINREKVPTHVVPMPLDVVALIVVGSIISLGLTTLAVLAVLHIRSRLFETIRLSIYDAEKREATHGTLSRGGGGGEKGNSTRISSMGCNSSILACEYETPRCIVPEHQTLPRPRPASSLDLMKKQEANYSNDYPNLRLFSNLQELLEAHYDRPPSTFRPAVFDIEGEHVYDEIPLQSSTTFTTKRDS